MPEKKLIISYTAVNCTTTQRHRFCLIDDIKRHFKKDLPRQQIGFEYDLLKPDNKLHTHTFKSFHVDRQMPDVIRVNEV